MTGATTALELTDVVKTYRGPGGQPVPVLNGISMTVAAGQSVAVLGRSGSGKSTLLAILGLLDTADRGSYRLKGIDTTRLPDRKLSRLRSRHLGFIYQRFFLLGHLSAYANVAAALQHGEPVPRRKRHQLVMDSLDLVGLADRNQHRPAQLSGGEQQRVAIARALVGGPSVILADEPTGALDEDTAEHIVGLILSAARQRGTAVVLVTHDQQVATRTDTTLRLTHGTWAE
ncbi:ABC transporter ATP-binding protein [Catellatospora citrea]|uniref:ABC transporter ATP-binding protein n=1 Tax=Catellatospora citrea TaxID=53366 RepID=UPI0033C2562B